MKAASIAFQLMLVVWAALFFAGSVRAQPLQVRTPRELLELHGIDASQLNRFRDGEPLGADDEETLIRILQRMPRMPKEKFASWIKPEFDVNAINESPADHRTDVHRVTGRVVRVERIPLLPEVATRLEFDSYFRIRLRVAEPPYTAIICTREIPSAWVGIAELDEPASAVGLFLKTAGQDAEGEPQWIYAAHRVAWHPSEANERLGVTPSQAYLASLGFDVGLLDSARAQNNKPLSLADRECFYALLAAAARADRSDFAAKATRPIDIVSLLREPTQHHGELMTLRGIARRATRVRVDDPDVQQRFGIDHYFQVDLFIDLGKQVIKFSKESSEEMPLYENSYPVTVCVLSLPPNLPEGELVRENIEVNAAFVKLWTYSSEYVTSFDQRLRQLSPLLIGTEPRVVQLPTLNPGFGIGLAALVLLSLGGIWFGLRWTSSPARAVVRRPATGPASRKESPEEEELPERPDFSGLDKLSDP